MDDMDFDLIEKDEVRDFLANKLEEVKKQNDGLQNSLKHRKEALLKLSAAGNALKEPLVVEDSWRKILSGKCIIAFDISNRSGMSPNHLNVLLDWSSTDSLSYKFYLLSSATKADILSEGIRWTQKLQETGLLVIVLEIPNFTNQLDYTFTGLLNFGTHDQRISSGLPPFGITCEEILSRTEIDEDPQNLVVSIAACNEKFEFVLLLPSSWNRSLDTVFETYCCLKRIDVDLKTGGYFVAQNVCPAFDQTLVEVIPRNEEKAPSVVDLNIYAKDFASVSSLIHYLHQRIVNVRIIPRHFYTHSAFVHPDITQCDPKEVVKSSVMEELKASQRFLEERDDSSNLDALINCKYQTNLAFLRWQEHKKQKESQ